MLAGYPSALSAMLMSRMAEGSCDVLELHDTEPAAVKLLLDYIYAVPVQLPSTHVVATLGLATRYQVGGLRDQACRALRAALDVENCAAIFAAADQYACGELRAKAKTLLVSYFAHVALRSEGFVYLDRRLVGEVLDSDHILDCDEAVLFEAAVRWLDAEPQRGPDDGAAVVRAPPAPAARSGGSMTRARAGRGARARRGAARGRRRARGAAAAERPRGARRGRGEQGEQRARARALPAHERDVPRRGRQAAPAHDGRGAPGAPHRGVGAPRARRRGPPQRRRRRGAAPHARAPPHVRVPAHGAARGPHGRGLGARRVPRAHRLGLVGRLDARVGRGERAVRARAQRPRRGDTRARGVRRVRRLVGRLDAQGVGRPTARAWACLRTLNDHDDVVNVVISLEPDAAARARRARRARRRRRRRARAGAAGDETDDDGARADGGGGASARDDESVAESDAGGERAVGGGLALAALGENAGGSRQLASGADDGTIRLWTIGTWECNFTVYHSGQGQACGILALARAGDHLVSGSDSAEIKVLPRRAAPRALGDDAELLSLARSLSLSLSLSLFCSERCGTRRRGCASTSSPGTAARCGRSPS